MTSTPQEHSNWTAAGSDVAAKNTYASIRAALEDIERRRSVDIFLQGSYANATNIRADSDVDIVVMTHLVFVGAVERLDRAALERYAALPDASYTPSALRAEVMDALVSYYGHGRVHPRNKCIKVDGRNGYVDADVVPCIEYRWFERGNADISSDYVEGIAIHPQNGGRIVNYPKEHIRNGHTKNALCANRYKETVRQVKRLRNRAVDQGFLADGMAPGYLLECMVYNVPSDEFVSDDSTRLREVALWLKIADKTSSMSCDGIHQLFKTDPGGFDLGTAQMIADGLWEAY